MSATVHAGYKKTEVGMLPEEWQFGELGDLNPIVTSGSRGWAKYYSDLGSAFLRITNLSRESIYVDISDLKHVRIPQNDTEGLRTQLQVGDLLISITADIGIIGYVDSSVPTPAYINQHIALLRFDETKIDTKFLSYFLASENPQRGFRAGTDQGAKAGMNLSGVRKIRAILPPIHEQRAIAGALSDVDALLAKLDALVTKKRDLKQAAMQQLLTGQTRLPGFSGEWAVKRLGELFSFSGGYTASRDQLSETGYCYLHYGDIHLSKKTFIDVAAEFLGIPKLAVGLNEVRSVSMLKDGDVVFVDASEDDEGTSRHVVVVNCDDRPYISGLHTIVAKSKGNRLDNLFKRYCFQTRHVKEQFRFFAVGTKVSGISKTSVAKVELSFPTALVEQRAIATILSDMDAELVALEARRDKTCALKQGVMQELLTGRIRLV